MATNMSAAPNQGRHFLLRQYFLKNGDQGARLAEFLQKGLREACARLHLPGPKLVLEALVAAHMPQVATVTPFTGLAALPETRARLAADKAFQAAVEKWEAGDAPYEHYTETVLEATDYCPELAVPATPAAAPRVFELRLYHSPTERQLKALHQRFAGPEVRIFARSGVHPLFYTSTLIGPLKPNLVYLIPFDNLAAREKAWAAFGADPEWIKVRAESIAQSGQISSVMQMTLYRAAAYSPIR